MSKSKTASRRSLVMSILSMLLCVAMLLGTTFAWFTDTATASVNKIQAGTLDVALEAKTGASGAWEDAEGKTLQFAKAAGHTEETVLWEPGCTYNLPDIRVINKGNLALKYKVVIMGIQGSAKLNEAITWTINYGGTETVADSGEYYLLPANTTGDTISVSGHMKEDAGNEYQGLSIDGISITVYATQLDNEYDSFTNQYDATAAYPAYAVSDVISGSAIQLKAYDSNSKLAASANIPAETVLPEGTEKIEMTVDEIDVPAEVTLAEEETALNLDVRFFSVASDGTKTQITDFGTQIINVDLSKEIPAGKELTRVYHTHGGTATEMTKATSAGAVSDGQYFYNATTKVLTIGSKTFSPFTFVLKQQSFEVIASKTGETDVGMSLAELRDSVNAGTTYAGWTITQQRDVDLSAVANFGMIGNATYKFAGIYDGNEKKISKLSITNTGGIAALFYGIADGVIIKDLTLSDVSIAGKYACALVGDAEKTKNYTISNVEVASGTIAGTNYGSAIVFDLEGSGAIIEKCVNRATISGKFCGGIVAYATGCSGLTMTNCENYGSVTGNDNAGGMIGQSTCVTYTNCRNYGTITASEGTWGQAYAGGIVGSGQSNTVITNCINNGNVSASQGTGGQWSAFAGGINGMDNGTATITYCINVGNITSNGDASGITGYSNAYTTGISHCYNSGSINAASGFCAAGVAGRTSANSITKCINAGTVSGQTNTYLLGITGHANTSYYYEGTTLKAADDTAADISVALAALNNGLETPFWGNDNGVIKPLSLISTT